ncbi:MAG: DUF5681 domain-containing protein [Sphingobium sp.]|nr:DUF5681 domain-containing protein [Sphingobium sp.]
MSASDDEQGKPKRRSDGTFEKGHTANRKGRPRGSQNLMTLFENMRDEKIPVSMGGTTKRISRGEIFMKKLWNNAMQLEPKATAAVLSIMRNSGQLDRPPAEGEALGDDDAAALAGFFTRFAPRETPDEPE